MEVDIQKTLGVLEILKRFVDPSGFIPSSRMVIFQEDTILTTAVWGGCLYKGPDSFLSVSEPLGVDVMVVSDLLASLATKKSGMVRIEKTDNTYVFYVGGRKVVFGSKIIEGPFMSYDRIKILPRQKISKNFLPALESLSFSVSENAYKSKFGGVWYSDSDKIMYASDNKRITWLPLHEPLGTNDNFFVPAIFLKKIPGIKSDLSEIALDGGLCYFFFTNFTSFFLVSSVKMPTFPEAVERVKKVALDSNNYFLLALDRDKREELLATKSLYFDDRGQSSDVQLTREGNELVVEVLHPQKTSSRSTVDRIPILDHSGEEISFRMDSDLFLDACELFDTFYVAPKSGVYVVSTETEIEQLIAWKG